MSPAILHAEFALAHAPDLVRYGSKPSRELPDKPELASALRASLRGYPEALNYPPTQVFIGNMSPDQLAGVPRPWWQHQLDSSQELGPFGMVVPEPVLYGLMKLSDDFDLLVLTEELCQRVRHALEQLPLPPERLETVHGVSQTELAAIVEREAGLPLYEDDSIVGFIREAHPRDDTLKAQVLLENLTCKATAVLALAQALSRGPVSAADIDFLLNSGEEAVGDRYQRGAGSLAKAVGEVVGCDNATGVDVKAFCASPVHSIIMAASLVEAGVHEHVVVVGGGSLAKLGMKFLGHLQSEVPIMEDLLGALAIVIGPSNGRDPDIRLDAVGQHPIGAGSSPKAIYQALVLAPLDALELKLTEVDRYAVELHNPEITEPAGSGDVPLTNYRTLAALAVLRGEIEKGDMDEFVQQHGMPGFAPTQGHIPAGVPYLGHARRAMLENGLRRVMVVAKGSLFLGRMTQLVDGISFILEKP